MKNGKRLCGTGGVLSNAPILQDKAYFEGKFYFRWLENSVIGIGKAA